MQISTSARREQMTAATKLGVTILLEALPARALMDMKEMAEPVTASSYEWNVVDGRTTQKWSQ